MSHSHPESHEPTQHHPPQRSSGSSGPSKPWYSRRWVRYGGVGAVIFLLGVACGEAGESEGADPTSAPAPTVTVTESVPGPEIPTGVTPQACIDAVETADEAFRAASKVLDIQSGLFTDEVPRALVAVANDDPAALEEASADLEEHAAEVTALTATLEVDRYQAAKAECISGGTP